jgi:hypothetical protein
MALLCLPTAIIASPIVIMYGGLGGHAGGGPPSTFDGWIATINQTTGAVTPIGHPAGVSRLSGLAFDSNGNLFGATQGNFPFPPVTPPSASALVQINPINGALLSNHVITAGGVPINISDLGFDTVNGLLYGVQGPNDGLNGQGLLYTINETTGIATLMGDTHSFFASIAFTPNGTLYMAAADLDFNTGNQINFRLETINPLNAAILTSVSTPQFYGALGIRPTDGVIFAGNGDAHTLYTLTTGGVEHVIGDTGTTFVGDIDFFVVPEPGTAVLFTLGLGGLIICRRKPLQTFRKSY